MRARAGTGPASRRWSTGHCDDPACDSAVAAGPGSTGQRQPTARAAATGGLPAGVPRRLPAERLLLAAARTAHAAASTGTIAGRGPACRDLCPAGPRQPADRPVVGVGPPGRPYLQPPGYAEPE